MRVGAGNNHLLCNSVQYIARTVREAPGRGVAGQVGEGQPRRLSQLLLRSSSPPCNFTEIVARDH